MIYDILCNLFYRGFSYVDLIEDARNHKDYALKRITCHSKEEERVAAQEVELMRRFKHPNIIPLEESANIKVSKYSKTLDILSEVLIVMPYYCVSTCLKDQMSDQEKKFEKSLSDMRFLIYMYRQLEYKQGWCLCQDFNSLFIILISPMLFYHEIMIMVIIVHQ